jgi:uncharacterized Zn finger protein
MTDDVTAPEPRTILGECVFCETYGVWTVVRTGGALSLRCDTCGNVVEAKQPETDLCVVS